MSNMVIFQTADGSPGYNQFEAVDEAVRFIEKLRNEQGIEGARMFALEEIKYQLKPYYKVELQALTTTTGSGSGPSGSSPSSSPSSSSPSAAPSSPSAPTSPGAPGGPGSSSSSPSSPSPAFAPPPGGAGAPPPPAATPPADAPSESESAPEQPQRRGLFGR